MQILLVDFHELLPIFVGDVHCLVVVLQCFNRLPDRVPTQAAEVVAVQRCGGHDVRPVVLHLIIGGDGGIVFFEDLQRQLGGALLLGYGFLLDRSLCPLVVLCARFGIVLAKRGRQDWQNMAAKVICKMNSESY